ncbi:tail protein X [Helicobacter ganmani]|uniref:tail protein X n=1 Tax=Helicobacter ganmani TaxID=60246 RepID=UPI0026298BFB|nr:tail protein X [Helicobacter sp. UBA3407]
MADLQHYENIVQTLSDKKQQKRVLEDRIANIENEPEVVEKIRIYNRFMDEYPFFTYRAGASGTLETKTLLFYKGLSNDGTYTNKRILIGKANNGSTYPTGRTTIARTYINASGVSVTTTANLNPSGNISASTSFCGHFKGNANIAPLREYFLNLPIGQIIKEQEDALDATEAIRAAHYPRELFADLEAVETSANEELAIINRLKDEILTQLNEECATLTAEISTLTQQLAELDAQADSVLLDSQTKLQETQQRYEELKASIDNVEELENLSEQIAENLKLIEELETKLKQLDTENLNLDNAELLAQIQELQNQIQEAQSQITQKEQEKTDLTQQLQQLQESLDNLGDTNTEAIDAEIAELQRQIAEIQEQIAQNQNTELNAQKESLKTQRDNLLNELGQLNQSKENLQNRIAQLQTQMEQLQEALAEIDNEELQTQIDTLEAQILELTALKEQKQLQGEELKAQITQKQQELESLQQLLAEIEKDTGELEELSNKIAQLQTQLEKYSQIQDAQSLLEDLQTKLQAAEDSHSLFAEELRQWHTNALKLAKQLGIELCRPLSNNVYPKAEEAPKGFAGYVYTAKDGERLDSIVYSHYGTLGVFEGVLGVNPKLTNKPILEAGDKVYLPFLDTNIKTLEELWG